MFDRIEFLLTEAFNALRRNSWMTFAAVTTATTALFLLGGLTFLFLSVTQTASSLESRIEIRAFVRDGTSNEAIREGMQSARKIQGVRTVNLITKDEAWREYQAKFPDVAEGLENPLPDALRIQVNQAKDAPDVARRIQSLPIVEPDGVRYSDEARQVVTNGLTTLRWLGIILGAVMLFTSGILIYNTIRMTIIARRREIRVMHLVGATQATILTPMIIEGVLQGAVGGLLAALLVWACHTGVQRLFHDLSVNASLHAFPVGLWVTFLVAVGSVYGLVCSVFAMRDPRSIRG